MALSKFSLVPPNGIPVAGSPVSSAMSLISEAAAAGGEEGGVFFNEGWVLAFLLGKCNYCTTERLPDGSARYSTKDVSGGEIKYFINEECEGSDDTRM